LIKYKVKEVLAHITDDKCVVATKPSQIPNPTNIPSIAEFIPKKPINNEKRKHKTNEFIKDKIIVFRPTLVFLEPVFEYFDHCLPKTKGEYHKNPIAI